MSKATARLVAITAFFMIVASLGLFALPRVVQALPGRYLVRLQSHPLTSGVVHLITTPMPAALPARSGAQVAATGPVIDIPGLGEHSRETQSLSAPGFAAEPPAEPAQEAASPVPSPTRETVIITVGEAATPEATAEPAEPVPTPSPTPAPTLPPLPERVMLEDVPVEVQTFNNCGPANMTIVLNYWGVETTQQQAANYLKPNEEDRNVSPWQITDYVNDELAAGVKSTAHASGTPDILKRLINAGFPVVIEKGYEPGNGGEGWYGHYLTVYGYDDAKQEFYSRDTYLGPTDGSPRIDKYDEFMKWWQQFYYTFYVIYPQSRAEEVFAIIPDVLQDDVTMWQHTVEVARRELQADSDNVFTWFNLGVALTRLGEVSTSGNEQYYLEATEAFDRARDIGLPPRTLYYEHRPLMAYFKTGRISDVLDLTGSLIEDAGGKWVEEIHWYRGHALAAAGDLIGAKEAYEAALEVNPNFYYAQISLDWVNDLIGN